MRGPVRDHVLPPLIPGRTHSTDRIRPGESSFPGHTASLGPVYTGWTKSSIFLAFAGGKRDIIKKMIYRAASGPEKGIWP